ncbi:hypothetical protein PTI98_009896 [Pleurotus ostreatus]|nr:hypothetical protein PTI98_009896 [Pleurotus ostreatus]
MSSFWGYSLRGNDFIDDQDEDDGAPDDLSTKSHLPNETDMLNDLDLSTREEAAVYKPNPWTIAKINAASRRPGGTDTNAAKKQPRSRGLGPTTRNPAKSHKADMLHIPRKRPSVSGKASSAARIASGSGQSQDIPQHPLRPTAVRPHTVLEGYYQRKPVGRPDITKITVTGPRLLAQGFPLPSATIMDNTTPQPGFEDATTAVMLSTNNPPILSTNRPDSSSLVPSTSAILSGQLSPHVSPAPPPRNLLPRTSGYNSSPLAPSRAKGLNHAFLSSPLRPPRNPNAFDTGFSSNATKIFQTKQPANFAPLGNGMNYAPPNLLPLPPSSPLLPSSPIPMKSPTSLCAVENSAPVRSRKRNISPPPSPPVKKRPKKDPYEYMRAIEEADDSSWSTLPARGKNKDPPPVLKTSGAFRLPPKFRPAPIGVDANVKKSGMSADSTRRVVTFLPPPLVAPQKPTTERAERSQLAYPSPTRASLLTVNNRSVDRSPQPVISTMQYPLSPPASDPPFAFQVPDQRSDDDVLLPFDADATERTYPTVRRLTSEVGSIWLNESSSGQGLMKSW